MRHRPYPKIPTTLDMPGSAGARWIATEKIHGAQLVVATDGTTVCFGKRKAWLDPADPFFGWQMLRDPLRVAVLELHRALGSARSEHLIYVYGELYGGHYPHPDVPPMAGLSAVQTGISYAPGLAWSPFDALVVRGEDPPVFVAHQALEAACEPTALRCPPCLGRGSRTELSRLPVRYASRVSAEHRLPPIADNIAEGFVLKPDIECTAADRPVVKHKIPEFDDNRFDGSRPFDPNAHLQLDELLRLAQTMMNPMRVDSARSKVGEGTDAVVEEMVLDVWIDLEAVFVRRMASLAPEEADRFRAGLTAQARAACLAPRS